MTCRHLPRLASLVLLSRDARRLEGTDGFGSLASLVPTGGVRRGLEGVASGVPGSFEIGGCSCRGPTATAARKSGPAADEYDARSTCSGSTTTRTCSKRMRPIRCPRLHPDVTATTSSSGLPATSHRTTRTRPRSPDSAHALVSAVHVHVSSLRRLRAERMPGPPAVRRRPASHRPLLVRIENAYWPLGQGT